MFLRVHGSCTDPPQQSQSYPSLPPPNTFPWPPQASKKEAKKQSMNGGIGFEWRVVFLKNNRTLPSLVFCVSLAPTGWREDPHSMHQLLI